MFRRLIIMLFTLGFAVRWHLAAQPDPPPGGPGGGDPPVGGSPLDDGLVFILVMAGLYGLWITRRMWLRTRVRMQQGERISPAHKHPRESG